MGPLNDENKLTKRTSKISKKNYTNNRKRKKKLKTNIINFKTIRYDLTALKKKHSFNPQLEDFETSQHFTIT